MQQMQQQASQSQQHTAGPPPPPTTGGSGTTISCTQYPSGQQASSDAILNFIKQNPAIITKPASPSPQLAAVLQQTDPRTQSPGAPPLHSGPPPQFLQQNLLAAQHSSMHSTSQQRIPSPISKFHNRFVFKFVFFFLYKQLSLKHFHIVWCTHHVDGALEYTVPSAEE